MTVSNEDKKETMKPGKPNSSETSEKGSKRTRFSARKKADTVVRLLRGEDIEALSRELNVPAYEISEWRERFLSGAEQWLVDRPGSPEGVQLKKQQEKIGELTMTIELLQSRIERMEGGRPLPPRRSRR